MPPLITKLFPSIVAPLVIVWELAVSVSDDCNTIKFKGFPLAAIIAAFQVVSSNTGVEFTDQPNANTNKRKSLRHLIATSMLN